MFWSGGLDRWADSYDRRVRETGDDLVELDVVLERSLAGSGEHLRSAFDQQHRLFAADVAAALGDIFEMHLATVARDGAPLAAPLDGVFFRGRVWFGLPAASLRARLVRRDPRVSASYNEPPVGMIVHGTAHEVDDSHPLFADYENLMTELYVSKYGSGWLEWYERLKQSPGRGFTGYVEPRVMFAKGA